MAERLKLGARIRTLRRRQGITQAKLAEGLGVSASYVNLLEHNHRSVSAAMLIKLTRYFGVDVSEFAEAKGAHLSEDLMEVFGDPVFEDHGLANVDIRDFVDHSPSVARAVRSLYDALKQSQTGRGTADGAQPDGAGIGSVPSEEVSDLVQERGNHFAELEEVAEQIWSTARLDLSDLYPGLVAYLRDELMVDVRVTRVGDEDGVLRHFDPKRRTLALSETLPPRSRNFQLAHVAALLTCGDLLDHIVRNAGLSGGDAQRLARGALANYVAGAVLMPYREFLVAAQTERYDLELIGHRFKVSLEQVCHRLTTLRRPGAEGIPFHMVRVDIAGNISKKFSATGIRFARFGAACSLWNVFQAFLTPGIFRRQLSVMPDGRHYFCIARTVPKGRGGFGAPHSMHAIALGCEVERAKEMVYSEGMDLSRLDTAARIGVSCRLCPRTDCPQRAFPQLGKPLGVDPWVKGVSTFSPA